MSADVEREEIEKLLPWYVTGRLTPGDRSKVERYLNQHPHMLAHLDLIRVERDETMRANDAIGRPPAGMDDRLMAALPQTRTVLPRRGSLSSLSAIFTMPTARGVQWAVVVAGLIVLAQAAVIATLITRGSDHTYQTASGAPPSNGVVALVAFSDDAKAPAIAQLLGEFDANIVDGPKPGGIYKIRVRSLDKSQPARDALLRKLAERRDVVRIVLPSGDW
jgi:anti-sigma factor RsiW